MEDRPLTIWQKILLVILFLLRQPEAMRLTESEWERFQEVKGKVLKARV